MENNICLLPILFHVGIELLTTAVIKNTIFWDVRLFRSPEGGGDTHMFFRNGG
jgi:hypothetical protein